MPGGPERVQPCLAPGDAANPGVHATPPYIGPVSGSNSTRRETWVPLDPCGARAGGGTSPSGGSLRSPPAKHGSTPFRGRHGLRASGCHHGWWFARRPHVLRWFVCHHRRWFARRPHVLRWFVCHHRRWLARARPQVLVSRSSSTCGLTLLANPPPPFRAQVRPRGGRGLSAGAQRCAPEGRIQSSKSTVMLPCPDRPLMVAFTLYHVACCKEVPKFRV